MVHWPLFGTGYYRRGVERTQFLTSVLPWVYVEAAAARAAMAGLTAEAVHQCIEQATAHAIDDVAVKALRASQVARPDLHGNLNFHRNGYCT
jgi:hypothetical protein